jgi:hypothetical protein
MGNRKWLPIATLSLLLALFEANVAEGYFLSSVHQRSGAILVSKAHVDSPLAAEPDHPPLVKEKEYHSNAKYPVIEQCHLKLAIVFGKNSEYWWHDWKLWVGLTLWLAVWTKWIMHGYVEVYLERAAFAFGINIIILHYLQYTSSILSGMIGVCSLLIAQSLFESYIWFASEPHEEDDADFICDTLYLDFGLPVEQVVVLFVAQFGVWWFYMTSILGNFDFEHVNYLFWLWAYLVMQMTMIFNRGADSVLGQPFPNADVLWIIQSSSNKADEGGWWALLDENGAKGEKFQISKANAIMRGLLGFFCNCILREIMAYTIPLMLMGFSEPMDFVVYCVGVNFICTLDDMSERTYVMSSHPHALSPRPAEIEQQPEQKTDPAEGPAQD